jgi:hypothetical protein
METPNTAPDPGWNSLYRIGGICLFAAGVFYFVATALAVVLPAPTNAETYLRALAEHRRVAFAYFAGSALADVLLVPAALALYFALRHLARTAVLLAATRPNAVPVELQVPLKGLAPGRYTCQLNVIDEVGRKFAFPRQALAVQ